MNDEIGFENNSVSYIFPRIVDIMTLFFLYPLITNDADFFIKQLNIKISPVMFVITMIVLMLIIDIIVIIEAKAFLTPGTIIVYSLAKMEIILVILLAQYNFIVSLIAFLILIALNIFFAFRCYKQCMAEEMKLERKRKKLDKILYNTDEDYKKIVKPENIEENTKKDIKEYSSENTDVKKEELEENEKAPLNDIEELMKMFKERSNHSISSEIDNNEDNGNIEQNDKSENENVKTDDNSVKDNVVSDVRVNRRYNPEKTANLKTDKNTKNNIKVKPSKKLINKYKRRFFRFLIFTSFVILLIPAAYQLHKNGISGYSIKPEVKAQSNNITDEEEQKMLEDSGEYVKQIFAENWKDIETDKKLDVFQSIVNLETSKMSVPNVKVSSYSTESEILAYYNPAEKQIYVNTDILNTIEGGQALNLILHECRHAYQHNVVSIIDWSDKNAQNNYYYSDARSWKENFDNYIMVDDLTDEEEFRKYEQQSIEVDARDYAVTRGQYYQNFVLENQSV